MPFKTAQKSPRAVRIAATDKILLRGAQTTLSASYSMALLGSLGRVGGSGDGSSGSFSSSDPDEYSEPSVSESLIESGDDVESRVDRP